MTIIADLQTLMFLFFFFIFQSEKFKDQLRNVQLEKMSVEDSLGRLHLLKSQDEEQIKKMSGQIDQVSLSTFK